MSGNQTFSHFSSFGPTGPYVVNSAGTYTVTDASAPLNVGEPGPTMYGLPSTFVGVAPNGLAFEVSISGTPYFYVLHDGTIPAYGDTINTSADMTIFPIAYNFDGVYCFLEGTGIATPTGEVPVESLKVGDKVTTAEGHSVCVKWVGVQTVANSLMTELNAAPVVITAGALGNGLPHTDLYVTADHGLIVDGFNIAASALVNHTTIRHVPMAEMPPTFTYYHVETEAHNIILANGAKTETFVDYAARRKFANYQEYLDLYGTERIVPDMKAPRITARRQVPDEIKARLDRGLAWDAVIDDVEMKISLSRGAA